MIHTYTMFDKNIVLDVNSGAVFEFDKLSFDIISKFDDVFAKTCPDWLVKELSDKYSSEEILGCYDEILSLCDQGLLFSDDTYDSIASQIGEETPIKALCLHIAHDCNLRCEYCFASTGDFGQGRRLMDFNTGKRAIDFVIQKSGVRKNIEIDFFGGEPLMNFEVVKEILEYAKKQGEVYNKNFRFTITTNGVLLNKKIEDYINQNMSNVVLSLDGRKPVNDRVRCFKDGSGCYDLIVPKFQSLVKNRNKEGHTDYYVRGTFTKYNKDFSKDVLHLCDLGFEQTSIEPVVSDKNLPYAINQDDLGSVFSEYERLAKEIFEKKKKGENFNFFHFMIDLSQGPCVIKRLKGCGSGSEYVAITPDGDIYPCHQFVGTEKYKMGNVNQSFDINSKISREFACTNIYTKEECKKCWAKFYCSGGCSANNYQYNKDINKPHQIACELEKKRVECAIWLKIALGQA